MTTTVTGHARGASAAADNLLVGLAFEAACTGFLCSMSPAQRLTAMADCVGYDTLAGSLATLAASERPLDDATRAMLHSYIFQTRQAAFEFKLHHAASA